VVPDGSADAAAGRRATRPDGHHGPAAGTVDSAGPQCADDARGGGRWSRGSSAPEDARRPAPRCDGAGVHARTMWGTTVSRVDTTAVRYELSGRRGVDTARRPRCVDAGSRCCTRYCARTAVPRDAAAPVASAAVRKPVCAGRSREVGCENLLFHLLKAALGRQHRTSGDPPSGQLSKEMTPTPYQA